MSIQNLLAFTQVLWISVLTNPPIAQSLTITAWILTHRADPKWARLRISRQNQAPQKRFERFLELTWRPTINILLIFLQTTFNIINIQFWANIQGRTFVGLRFLYLDDDSLTKLTSELEISGVMKMLLALEEWSNNKFINFNERYKGFPYLEFSWENTRDVGKLIHRLIIISLLHGATEWFNNGFAMQDPPW